MDSFRLIIVPSEAGARVLAKTTSGATVIRALLPAFPSHTHAVPRFLTGLGSFVPVHAALVVPAKGSSSATRLYPDWFADVGGDGYDLQIIGGSRHERRAWWGR